MLELAVRIHATFCVPHGRGATPDTRRATLYLSPAYLFGRLQLHCRKGRLVGVSPFCFSLPPELRLNFDVEYTTGVGIGHLANLQVHSCGTGMATLDLGSSLPPAQLAHTLRAALYGAAVAQFEQWSGEDADLLREARDETANHARDVTTAWTTADERSPHTTNLAVHVLVLWGGLTDQSC